MQTTFFWAWVKSAIYFCIDKEMTRSRSISVSMMMYVITGWGIHGKCTSYLCAARFYLREARCWKPNSFYVPIAISLLVDIEVLLVDIEVLQAVCFLRKYLIEAFVRIPYDKRKWAKFLLMGKTGLWLCMGGSLITPLFPPWLIVFLLSGNNG